MTNHDKAAAAMKEVMRARIHVETLETKVTSLKAQVIFVTQELYKANEELRKKIDNLNIEMGAFT